MMLYGKRVLFIASGLFLSASLAFAADSTNPERHLAKIKKGPNGTVSLKQVANYNDYQTDKEYHAQLQSLTDPVAIMKLKAKHNQLNITSQLNGGLLNGTMEIGTSVVTFTVSNTADSSYSYTFSLPANFEVDSAPHQPGAPIDTFATNMVRIEGSTTAPNELFDYVHLVGGTANGYNSPGQMSIIDKGDSVLIDSFFNVGFRLEFRGAAGGPLEGLEDAVVGNVTMRSQASQGSAPANQGLTKK